MHDLCERRGDFAVVGGVRAEIARIERVEAEALSWRVVLAAPYQGSSSATDMRFERDHVDGALVFNELYDVTLVADPGDTHAVVVTLPPEARLGDEDPVIYMLQALGAQASGDPPAVAVGDPNGNVSSAPCSRAAHRPWYPEPAFSAPPSPTPRRPVMPWPTAATGQGCRARGWCGGGPDADGRTRSSPRLAAFPPCRHRSPRYPELGEASRQRRLHVQSNLPSSDDRVVERLRQRDGASMRRRWLPLRWRCRGLATRRRGRCVPEPGRRRAGRARRPRQQCARAAHHPRLRARCLLRSHAARPRSAPRRRGRGDRRLDRGGRASAEAGRSAGRARSAEAGARRARVPPQTLRIAGSPGPARGLGDRPVKSSAP